MKSFKQHLLESKHVYEFKIKIAGEVLADQINKLKGALDRFNIESFSTGIRTPIQETQIDFPEHKNISTTSYDVILTYPATSFQIRQIAADALGLSECCIKVRNAMEEEEVHINHANDIKSGKALIGSDYNAECNQHLVGETQKLALLKELSKVKHQGTQYSGVNDELLAKKMPAEKPAAVIKSNQCTNSTIGSTQAKLPTAKGKK